MAKKNSPSRQRYEADRPVIWIRFPAELKLRIAAHLRATGKTYTQWVTELLQGQADHAREVKDAYERGLQDCSRWLARLYLKDEEQFEAVFGGLVYLAEQELGQEAGYAPPAHHLEAPAGLGPPQVEFPHRHPTGR